MTYGVVNSGLIQMRGGENDAVNAVGAGMFLAARYVHVLGSVGDLCTVAHFPPFLPRPIVRLCGHAQLTGTVTGVVYGLFKTTPPTAKGVVVSSAVGATVALAGSVIVAFLDGEVNPVRSVQNAFDGFSSGISVD